MESLEAPEGETMGMHVSPTEKPESKGCLQQVALFAAMSATMKPVSREDASG